MNDPIYNSAMKRLDDLYGERTTLALVANGIITNGTDSTMFVNPRTGRIFGGLTFASRDDLIRAIGCMSVAQELGVEP